MKRDLPPCDVDALLRHHEEQLRLTRVLFAQPAPPHPCLALPTASQRRALLGLRLVFIAIACSAIGALLGRSLFPLFIA